MKSLVIVVSLFLLLFLVLGTFIAPTWVRNYCRLSTVRKTSPNYLKITDLSNKKIVFETEVDMTSDKLYFHNSYPCLVICLDNKKYTNDDIECIKIEVESIDKTKRSQEKFFKATDFKYVARNQKKLVKCIGRDLENYICFYPIGMIKLAPGLNKFTVVIRGSKVFTPNDIKAFLYFHETSNTMILLEPIKYLPLPGG